MTLQAKVINECTLKHLEELITCPFYQWRTSPFACRWKALSDECLNKRAQEYWLNKKD